MVCRMWIQRLCEFQSIAKGSNSFILYFLYGLVTLSLLDNSVAPQVSYQIYFFLGDIVDILHGQSDVARMFCHSVWKTTRAAIRKTPLKFVHGVLDRVLSDDGALGNFVLSLIPCALDAIVKQRMFANWHV